MKILIAGGTGFIGRLLTHHLSQHHELTVVGRNISKLEDIFSNEITKITWDGLKNLDARPYDLIMNFSGSSIGEKRWNAKIKRELIDSRIQTNHQLIQWLINHHAKPRFFCASAIGIYGAKAISTEFFDESSILPQVPEDFLQEIGFLWEQSLAEAINAGIQVTMLRLGVVLKQGEGMLKKLEPSFRWGLGAILGSGQQILTWVYYKDLIQAIDFIIQHPELSGPINITSPYPVMQKKFAQQLSSAFKRPLFLKLPGSLIKLGFGEMGESLLLKGQGVLPKRLEESGFKFNYPQLESVLREEYQTARSKEEI